MRDPFRILRSSYPPVSESQSESRTLDTFAWKAVRSVVHSGFRRPGRAQQVSPGCQPWENDGVMPEPRKGDTGERHLSHPFRVLAMFESPLPGLAPWAVVWDPIGVRICRASGMRGRRRGEKADSFGCARMSPGVPKISRIQEACQEFWSLRPAAPVWRMVIRCAFTHQGGLPHETLLRMCLPETGFVCRRIMCHGCNGRRKHDHA